MKRNLLTFFLCFILIGNLLANPLSKVTYQINTADTGKMGNTWAVIVGVSKYQNVLGLNYADKDALAFYDYLVNKKRIDSSHVQVFINEKAIASNIYGALDWLNLSIKEGDRVIFYFSGHGDVETKTIRQNGFLLAHDAPVAAYMTKGTVSINFLQDYLATFIVKRKANDVLLIVDACRAGKLAGGNEGLQITMHTLGQNWDNQIIKILSAQEGESSYEDRKWGGGRGVFSYYLEKGLEGLASRNTDTIITTAELAAYLPFAVSEATNAMQNPTILGNPKQVLFSFNKRLLALANPQEDKKSFQKLSAIRGANTNKDAEIDTLYKKYCDYLQTGRLIWGNTTYDTLNCAKYYYSKLLANNKAHYLIPSLKSSFLASLKRKAEIKLDDYINGKEIDDYQDEAYNELNYALKLVDTSYILYNYLTARMLFLASFRIKNTTDQTNLLKKVIQIEPDAAYAYNKLGSVMGNMELKIDSAIYYLKKAITLSPSWALTFKRLANYYYFRENFDQAISYQEQVISLEPKNFKNYLVLENFFLNKNDKYRADSIYKKVINIGLDEIKIDSTYDVPYYNLGHYYLLKNDLSASIFYLNKASKLNITNNLVNIDLGNIYLKIKKYSQAVDCFLKVSENNSKIKMESYLGITNAYLGLKEVEKAIKTLNKSIFDFPQNIDLYTNLAKIYIDIKLNDSAKVVLDRALLELGKNNMNLSAKMARDYQAIGLIYNRTGDSLKTKYCYAKSISILNSLIVNNPEMINFDNELIIFYVNSRELTKAEKLCLEAINKHPYFLDFYYNLSCIYAIGGRIDESLKYLELAYAKGFYYSYEDVIADDDLSNIRDLPAFKAIMKKYYPERVK